MQLEHIHPHQQLSFFVSSVSGKLFVLSTLHMIYCDIYDLMIIHVIIIIVTSSIVQANARQR